MAIDEMAAYFERRAARIAAAVSVLMGTPENDDRDAQLTAHLDADERDRVLYLVEQRRAERPRELVPVALGPVQRFVNLVRAHMRDGAPLDSAVRLVSCMYPALCVEVLDTIGSWPSSEPELASLQRIR